MEKRKTSRSWRTPRAAGLCRRALASGVVAAMFIVGLAPSAYAVEPQATDSGTVEISDEGLGAVEQTPALELELEGTEEVSLEEPQVPVLPEIMEEPNPEPVIAEPAAPQPAAPESKPAAAETQFASSDEQSVAPLLEVAEEAAYAPILTAKGATALEVNFSAYLQAYPSSMGSSYVVQIFAASDLDNRVFQVPYMHTMAAPNPIQVIKHTAARPVTAGTSYVARITSTGMDENYETVVNPDSAFSAVTTTAAEPLKPGVIPAAPEIEVTGATSVFVSWASLLDNPEALHTYTVTLYEGENTTPVKTVTNINPFTDGTSAAFTGLKSNTYYSARVTAIGYDQNGDPSEPSAQVRTSGGVPHAVPSVTVARSEGSDTGVTVTWEPTTNDGGLPLTGHLIRFWVGSSSQVANIFHEVTVPAGVTSYTIEETGIVGQAIAARVFPINAAGTAGSSPVSTGYTRAADTGLPADMVANGVNMPRYAYPTTDGFTLFWKDRGTSTTAPATANKTAETGYLLRVVRKMEHNADTTGAQYTVRLIYVDPADLRVADVADVAAFGDQVDGALKFDITDLESARQYRVSVTPYELKNAGTESEHRLYRRSTNPAQALATGVGTGANRNGASLASNVYVKTLGKGAPIPDGAIPPAPVAENYDRLSWAGAEFAPGRNGGADITDYRVYLYQVGATDPVMSIIVPAGAGQLTAEFSGLQAGTWYQVAYAGINEIGEGQQTVRSEGARTDMVPRPGSVLPPYSTYAELESAIAAKGVDLVSASAFGLSGQLESDFAYALSAQFGADASGAELWAYRATEELQFVAEYPLTAGRVSGEVSLSGAPQSLYLVMYPDRGKPVAVKVALVAPAPGRTELTDAVFRWGINNESNNGAFYGGCNFFVAGKIPNPGSSTMMGQGGYQAEAGNVRIEKLDSNGDYQLANWNNKCRDRYGAPVNSSGNTGFTESQVVISGGEGWVEPALGSAEIQWTGDFSVVYYGGLTFWYASNPKLVLEDGYGKLTATLSGYGTDMDDMAKWVEIEPREITLANFTKNRAALTSGGLSALPDYLGVAIDSSGGRNVQPDYTAGAAAIWGSFPQDFVDFQVLTGQSSYWYFSGGSQDRFKLPSTLYVGYDAKSYEPEPEPEPEPTPGGEGGIDIVPPLAPPGKSAGSGGGSENSEVQQPAPPAGALPKAMRPPGAGGEAIDTVDKLLAAIEAGLVQLLEPQDAGVATEFYSDDVLRFSFAWDGDSSEGVLWVLPDLLQAGTFRVLDGRVELSMLTDQIATLGDVYFVFFGDAGEIYAVSVSALGADLAAEPVAAQTPETTPEETVASQPVAAAVAAPISGDTNSSLTYFVLALGLLVILASATGAVVLVRRATPK